MESQTQWTEFATKVESRLKELEDLMVQLEAENDRLRKVNVSTYFERDACLSLIGKMARLLKLNVGVTQNRLVLDLPSGQVSWDFMDEEAHLFEEMPEYKNALLEQSVQENYTKVMNPGIEEGKA